MLVERKRGPEANHAGEAGAEKAPELAGFRLARTERRRLRQDRAEAAGIDVSPGQEREPERDQERRFDIQKETDRFDALVNDEHIDPPEKHEANELGQRDPEQGRRARSR